MVTVKVSRSSAITDAVVILSNSARCSRLYSLRSWGRKVFSFILKEAVERLSFTPVGSCSQVRGPTGCANGEFYAMSPI